MDRATLLTPADWGRVRSLALTAEEGFLYSRCAGPMTVSELLLSSGMSEAQALGLLQSLVEKGALQLDSKEASKWGAFVFDQDELNEPVDIDPELRKEILFRYETRAQTSHWRVLEVEVDTPLDKVRLAFIRLANVFHPDKFSRKQTGSYAPKIRAVFERLTEAREVLSDDELRRRYEREGKGFTQQEQMALANLEISRLDAEKRLRASRERSLRGKGFARLTKAREELRAGDRALARGDYVAALAHYELALELDPRLEEARQRIVEARRVAQIRRADQAFDVAGKAEKAGEIETALDAYRDAAKLDPSSARAQLALGRLQYREAQKNGPGELKMVSVARQHVARALELEEPEDRLGTTYLLHAEILIDLNLKKLARQQLELAAAAGEEERAKVLLKKC